VWTSSHDGQIGTGGSFSTQSLSIGSHVITASVTDSANATVTAQITLTIDGIPVVAITAPASGTVRTLGSSMSFSATATDPEDGNVAASLVWTSNVDGQIGTGGSFSTAGLSAGTHTITATATDSRTQTGSAQISVRINQAPAVAITGPADGSTRTIGTSVTFTGTAVDPENGNVAATLVWVSNHDGQIGTGASFSTSGLTAGVHTITATATDNDGVSNAAQITLTINRPPTVVVNAPANNSTKIQGDGVTFTGSASDPENGNVTASLVWTSSIDGQIGLHGPFSTASLSPGVHTITATATDTPGATGFAQITVTVDAPPVVTITAPADGSFHTAGTPVTFTATATDLESGNLASSVQWISDIDGPLHTGGSFSTSTLSIGTHSIMASVTDPSGAVGEYMITVEVTP
jgi:hypothetical protein